MLVNLFCIYINMLYLSGGVFFFIFFFFLFLSPLFITKKPPPCGEGQTINLLLIKPFSGFVFFYYEVFCLVFI